MNNTVCIPVVWFAKGVFYTTLNQNISYLKLTSSTMSQIQKVVTHTTIVIITLMMMMMMMMMMIIIIIIIVYYKDANNL
jgi:hypothetical protein